MAIESGASVDLAYVEETTHGTTPNTPAMIALRATGRNINLTKNTLDTQEVRSDEQISDQRHDFQQVQGTVGFELSRAAYDDWLRYGMKASGWNGSAADTGTTTLDAVAGTSKITRASGSFVGDGFEPGDWVTVAGSHADNNGTHLVTAVTATELTLASTLTDDTGGGDEQVTVIGETVKNGTTLKTMTIERRFTGLTRYQVFRGCAINQWTLGITPGQMVGGQFSLIGMSAAPLSGASLGTPTAAPANSPFAPTAGAIYVQGVAAAVITAIDLQVANNLNVQAVVGATTSPDVFKGQTVVTGSMSAMMEDESMVNYFVNETEIAIAARLDDPNGTDFFAVYLPRVKVNSATIDPPQTGPVIVQMQFQALRSASLATTLKLQKSNA